MIRHLFNSQLPSLQATINRVVLSHSRVPAFANSSFKLPSYRTSLLNNPFLSMKLYDVKPDEPIVDPEDQPGYYNVYDEDEYPEERKEPEREDINNEKPLDSNINRVPPSEDPKGPLDEQVL